MVSNARADLEGRPVVDDREQFQAVRCREQTGCEPAKANTNTQGGSGANHLGDVAELC